MNAYIVLDLGFGDCGKGLLTDFLVRQTGAKVVVRYNGGAQAGHNVVTADGIHHTFAQFGAGSLVPGVRTFLSRHVVVHPTALLVESRVLGEKGVKDPLGQIRISELARIITPFHQAGNRIRELARGMSRHGTCGVGVGETVKDALEYPDEAILAGDLRSAKTLKRKLERIGERKRGELRILAAQVRDEAGLEHELGIFDHPGIVDNWIDQSAWLASQGVVVPDSTLGAWMAHEDTVVFEGAQGALLDEWWGFHPFTSWSTCTALNAIELLDEFASGSQHHRVGVLRAHAIRHGSGPFPTETDAIGGAIFDHNRRNDWQGPVRYGWFDAVLTRYALGVVGGVDVLAVTHVDAVLRMPVWKACRAYRLDRREDAELIAPSGSENPFCRLHKPTTPSLARQARLAEIIGRCEPLYEACKGRENAVLERIEALLETEVDIVSRGPRAQDVSFCMGAYRLA